MNTDSTISLTFVRDRIKAFYDIMDTKKDAYIDMLLLNSVREMQSYKYVTQQAFTLDICDCKAQLPCNYKTVLAVVPPCGDGCTPIIYSEFMFDGVQGNCEWTQVANRWKIQDGWIVFPSNFEFDSVDIYCDVYILGDDGYPVLKEAHLPYYESYGLFKFGLKISDARYKEFRNYATIRRNLVHNEQVDQFNYDKLAISAIVRQIGLAGYGYYGNYGGYSTVYPYQIR